MFFCRRDVYVLKLCFYPLPCSRPTAKPLNRASKVKSITRTPPTSSPSLVVSSAERDFQLQGQQNESFTDTTAAAETTTDSCHCTTVCSKVHSAVYSKNSSSQNSATMSCNCQHQPVEKALSYQTHSSHCKNMLVKVLEGKSEHCSTAGHSARACTSCSVQRPILVNLNGQVFSDSEHVTDS